MEKSENISNLALSLSLLQGEIKDVHKDKKGYGYSYADLSSVLEIIRPLLSKYKLALAQLPGCIGERLSLTTMLMHESGQWISSTIEMPIEKAKNMSLAQATGSVMTYARRYALAAIMGVAQTDNDASIVCAPEARNSHPEQSMANRVLSKIDSRKEVKTQALLDDSRIDRLSELYVSNKDIKGGVDKYLNKLNLEKIEQLTVEQADKLIFKIAVRYPETETVDPWLKEYTEQPDIRES